MEEEERQRQIFFLQQNGPLKNERAHLMKKFLMIENCQNPEKKAKGESKSLKEQLDLYWMTR
jgi:hypothetical protein